MTKRARLLTTMTKNQSRPISILISVLLGCLWAEAGLTCEAIGAREFSPLELYGEAIEFDVLRNGKPVGQHVTRFEQDGDRIVVHSEMSLKVDFLFFTAFRFNYRSTDEWCGDTLVRMRSSKKENDRLTEVLADRSGDGLTILTRADDAERTIETEGVIFPTNHWDARVVQEPRVLNTLTGGINAVEIISRGPETVATEQGEIRATRYSYTGELSNDVWYDAAGRWVKLEFSGRDGSTISYRCRRCQPESNLAKRDLSSDLEPSAL